MTETVPCKPVYEIWTTPPPYCTFDDTNTAEKRRVFGNATDHDAEVILLVLNWVGCDCEKRAVYVPTNETEGEDK